ncbi:GerMN domain-containing protein [Micromonospora sp. NPDC047527]|uniref:GerMN domain-containing protein n=1 Tax=unclassified Micromonospora TaxID=2617518 RepID=UPI0033D76F55
MNRRLVVTLTLTALLTGCGIPTDDAARPVRPPRGPFLSTAAPTDATTAPPGSAVEILCLVRDNRIVPVIRRVDRPPTVEEHLRHLLAGPTTVERDDDLTSALAGAVTAAGATVNGAQAHVAVDEPGHDVGRSDEVLAFGQIVCTLTSRDDVATVTFLRDGKPLGVPRADGSLTEQPLTRADFAPLIVPQ